MGIFNKKSKDEAENNANTANQNTKSNEQSTVSDQSASEKSNHRVVINDMDFDKDIEKIVVTIGDSDTSIDTERNRNKTQQNEKQDRTNNIGVKDFTSEQKNSLGQRFLLCDGIPSEKDIAACSIQEISFLMKSAVTFFNNETEDSDSESKDKQSEADQNEKAEQNKAQSDAAEEAKSEKAKKLEEQYHLNDKFNLFHKVYIDKFKELDKLYIMVNPMTTYPVVDGQDFIWMFTMKELAYMAKKHFEEDGTKLTVQELDQDKIMQYFADLYTLGMEHILVDMGGYMVPIQRADILPPPDFSKTPAMQIPVLNPDMNRHILSYLQVAYTRKKGEQMTDVELQILNQVICDIAQAKFLCPVQYENKGNQKPVQSGKMTLKKDTLVKVAFATNKNGNVALPIFTDWNMFHKMYDDKEWYGQILTCENALGMAQDKDIVINPMGIEFHITDILREPLSKACEYYKNQKQK